MTVASLIDKRIEAALDRGDIEGASLLAAQIANPAGYLAAMQVVNQAMNKPQETGMLAFKSQTMKLASVNVRREMAGKSAADGRTASDLQLVVKGGNDLLDKLSPHLRGSFYSADVDKQGVLVPHALTKLIHPLLVQDNLLYDLKLAGYKVTIDHAGNPESAIVLDDCQVNNFRLNLEEGGTVAIAMRVQYHPAPGQLDPLAGKLQQEVTVTMEPPKVPKQDKTPKQQELAGAAA